MNTTSENKVSPENDLISLDQLQIGDQALVIKVEGEGKVRRRLLDMGLTPGAKVYLRKTAPLGDPIQINLRGFELTLRKVEAKNVLVRILPKEQEETK
jgi:ferrous iron transport protein A